ncbi:MAG TPA: hypothetical protein VMZ52_17850 [Bryobacteraceae bacterium]|nr:hypothetical protein [Bryobacteraceae bacterium]
MPEQLDVPEKQMTVEHVIEGPLMLRLSVPYELRCFWLQRSAMQTVRTEIGARTIVAAPARVAVCIIGDFGYMQIAGRLQILSRSSAPEVLIEMRVEEPDASEINDFIATLPDKGGNGDELRTLAAKIFRAAGDALRIQLFSSLTALATEREEQLPFLEMLPGQIDGDSIWRGNLRKVDVAHTADSLLKNFCGNRVAVEVHLPYLDRIHWRKASDTLVDATVTCNSAGQVLVMPAAPLHPPDLAIAALGLVVQSKRRRENDLARPFHLAFTDQRDRTAAQVAELVRPYGLNLSSWLRDEREMVNARVTLRLPSDVLSVWMDAPRERSARYFPTYAHMSRRLQRCLRRWLPYAYFDSPVRYQDSFTAQAMLLYKASEAYAGKLRTQLSYDLLSNSSVDAFFRSGLQGLPEMLSFAHSELLRAGDQETAELYLRRNSKEIVQHIRKWHKKVDKLLAGDCRIVDGFLQLGLQCALISQQIEKDAVYPSAESCEIGFDWYETMKTGLQRLYTGSTLGNFSSLLLLEATASLHDSLRQKRGVEAKVQIVRASGEARTFLNTAWHPS